ncbi:MAG: MBL fold metallo-hydrolase [Pseudomonadota bacterium]
MMIAHLAAALFFAFLLVVTPQPALAQDAAANRSMVEIGPGVYRTQDNRHFGLVVDTDDGVVVFDTFNAGFATWLDQEIATRLNKPVRYVIYSHNHADHTSGGEVFAKHNPLYVSHELARDSHVRMKTIARPADLTFETTYTIRLGGREIELRYHGPNDGRGSISLFVPDAKILSVIDWVVIGRLSYKELNRYDVEGTIAALRDLEKMDFDLVSPGHADMGDKAGLIVERRYLEALRDAIIPHIIARSPMDLVVSDVTEQLRAVPEFAKLKQFDGWVGDNIKGVHFQLSRIEGFADGALPDPEYATK